MMLLKSSLMSMVAESHRMKEDTRQNKTKTVKINLDLLIEGALRANPTSENIQEKYTMHLRTELVGLRRSSALPFIRFLLQMLRVGSVNASIRGISKPTMTKNYASESSSSSSMIPDARRNSCENVVCLTPALKPSFSDDVSWM